MGSEAPEFLLNEASHKLDNLINGAADLLQTPLDAKASCGNFRKKVSMIYQLEWLDNILGDNLTTSLRELVPWLREKTSGDMWLAMFCWVYLDCLRASLGMPNTQFIEQTAKWRFMGIIESALWDIGPQISSPGELARSVALLLRVDGWLAATARRSKSRIMRDLLSDSSISDYFKVNDYRDKTWFGKESAETAFFLFEMEGMMEILSEEKQTRRRKLVRMEKLTGLILSFKDAAETSGYDLNRFLEILDQV